MELKRSPCPTYRYSRDIPCAPARIAAEPYGIRVTIQPLTAVKPDPLAEAILDTLAHRIGKDASAARPHDWLAATILTVRDDIIDRWMESTKSAHSAGAKRVYYLSL